MKRKRKRRVDGTSRREFLRLAAAGSMAAMAAPALALANETKAEGKKPAEKQAASAAPPENVRAGIEEQKGYLRDALARIREHELPTNSEQAMVFRPLKALARKKAP